MDFNEMASIGLGSGRPDTAPTTSVTTSTDNDILNVDFDGFSSQKVPQQQPRIPTFKEFGETIRQLQHDNFQLKLRLYLQETKHGKSQVQSGTNNVHETTTSAASVELMREFQNLRQSNENLQLKLNEYENRNKSLQMKINDGLNDNDNLRSKNEILMSKLNILDRELALLKLKKEEDDDIEQCIQAFHGDDDIFLSGQIHGPSSPQFLEFQRHRIEELEKERLCWKQERSAMEEEHLTMIENIKQYVHEISEHDQILQRKDDQFKTTISALRDMGNMYKTEQAKVKIIETKYEDLKRSLSRQKEVCEKSDKTASTAVTKEKAIWDKLSRIRQIMDLLKTRVTDLVEFVEALLQLESRGILSLTGLTPEHRDSVRVAMEQSQILSDTIIQILAEDWLEEERLEANKLKYSKLGLMQSEYIQIPNPGEQNNNLLDGGDIQETSASLSSSKTSAKLSTAAKSIQCEREHELNFEASSQINLLTTEKKKLEDTKNRLVTEKGILYARVATLEANLNAIKELSYPLQIEQLKTQIEKRMCDKQKLERNIQFQKKQMNQMGVENRALFERLQMSESSLKRLHHEHSKLVSELKVIGTVCPVKENHEKIIKVGLSQKNRQDDSSPDLGIESGHEAHSTVSSPKHVNTPIKSTEEYKLLKNQNRELASKLKHTKLALAKTIEKLDYATSEKEQFEKAVCRELHQTHSILKEAQVRLEVDVDSS